MDNQPVLLKKIKCINCDAIIIVIVQAKEIESLTAYCATCSDAIKQKTAQQIKQASEMITSLFDDAEIDERFSEDSE